MTGNIIITRHTGLVEWLKRCGITGEVIPHVTDVQQICDKAVYGVLPLNLAYHCRCVVSVDLPLLRSDQRGRDLSPEELDEAGATLQTYVVVKASGDTLERQMLDISKIESALWRR